LGLVFITHLLIHEEKIFAAARDQGVLFQIFRQSLETSHKRLGLFKVTRERIERRKVIEPEAYSGCSSPSIRPYISGPPASIAALPRFGPCPIWPSQIVECGRVRDGFPYLCERFQGPLCAAFRPFRTVSCPDTGVRGFKRAGIEKMRFPQSPGVDISRFYKRDSALACSPMRRYVRKIVDCRRVIRIILPGNSPRISIAFIKAEADSV